MPVTAASDTDPIRLPSRLPIGLSHHLRRTARAVTGWIGRPRGAALSPSAAPLTPIPFPVHGAGVPCCCPCSVELPGEAA
jgi:hypothetical protein